MNLYLYQTVIKVITKTKSFFPWTTKHIYIVQACETGLYKKAKSLLPRILS